MFLPAVQNQNQGLNGFFGRLAKKLIGLALKSMATIPIFGPLIADTLDGYIRDWTNNYGGDGPSWWNRTEAEYEPTYSEETILTPWFETKFLPFYQTIATQLSSAFQIPNAQAQIAAINQVMTKICVAKEYHKLQNTAGLSKSAIAWRIGVMDEVLLPLENLITTSMSKFSQGVVMENASASTTTAVADYAPLIPASGFVLANYACKNYRLTSTDNGTVIAPVVSIPATAETPAKEIVIPITGNPNLPAESESGTKTETVVAVVGIATALYLFFGGSGKTKKSK